MIVIDRRSPVKPASLRYPYRKSTEKSANPDLRDSSPESSKTRFNPRVNAVKALWKEYYTATIQPETGFCRRRLEAATHEKFSGIRGLSGGLLRFFGCGYGFSPISNGRGPSPKELLKSAGLELAACDVSDDPDMRTIAVALDWDQPRRR